MPPTGWNPREQILICITHSIVFFIRWDTSTQTELTQNVYCAGKTDIPPS